MSPPRLAAFAWLTLILLISLLAPALAPYDATAVNPSQSLAAPSPTHLLGTDLLGRDVYSRLLWGSRRTLGMALLAIVVTSLPGAALGLLAGTVGEPLESWLLRGVEVMLALPQLLVALVAVAVLGQTPVAVGLAVGLAGIASFARLTRAVVAQVRGQIYVQAAEALGMSPLQIITRHILRNIAPTLVAFTTIHFAWALLNTATLSFLGFSGNPSAPDWGMMLNEGRAYLVVAPWVSTAPGAIMALTVLAVNILGEQRGKRER
jgi:ABC-type dipeptide/oligopeptide/nickel transport system permease subunit